jgi:hypothetical protein
MQAGDEILLSSTNKLINSVWNKEELLDQWKESIIVQVHEKGDKADYNNYRGISWLSISYKIVSIILLSRLVPYIDKIIWDNQCGFRRNRSTTIIFSAFVRYWRKNGSTISSTSAIHRLQESP